MWGGVRRLTNDQLEFQYDVLEEIITASNLHNVQVAILSFVGPTRTGKSYLLNILHYLFHNRYADDSNMSNMKCKIPQVFESTCQSDSQTKGIYMTAEPTVITTKSDKKVAVFLMDTAGIAAGDTVEFKEAEIFTISSVLSFMQVLNVRNRIGYEVIDSYAALTLFARTVFPSNEIEGSQTHKLLLLVRDWEYYLEHNYGHEGGMEYYRKLCSVKEETPIQYMKSCYRGTDCFLVPHPGFVVATSNTKFKSAIRTETWNKFVELYDFLFGPNAILQATDSTMTGEAILQASKDLMKNLTDAERISSPDKSFKGFRNYCMELRVSKCSQHYNEEIKMYEERQGNCLNLRHEIAQQNAIKMLEKDAFGDISDFKGQLVEKITEIFEIIKGHHLVENQVTQWNEEIKKKGNFLNAEVKQFFLEEGKKYREEILREMTSIVSRERILKEFQKRLAEMYTIERKRRLRNKRIAACVAATAVGLAGAASLAAIPAFVAFAAALSISTPVVVGGGAAAMGAGGGAVAGGVAGVMTKAFPFGDSTKAPDFDSGDVPASNAVEDESGREDGDESGVNDKHESVREEEGFEVEEEDEEEESILIRREHLRLFFDKQSF